MSKEYMEFSQLNNTAKFLSQFIFKGKSLQILRNFGLENVFIADYGYRTKSEYCLFFLINSKINYNSKDYETFEDKITSFDSFYDWYEVFEDGVEKRMYVFTVNEFYREDYYRFIHEMYDELSMDYWSALGARTKLDISHIEFILENEIYRFNQSLEIKENKKGR